jgi:hypothetical protein
MSTHSIRSVLVVIALSALTATCDEPPDRVPTGPTAPSAQSFAISGPDSIAPGMSAQFAASARLTDGTTKAVAASGWRTFDSGVLLVNPTGLATAGQQRAETILVAEFFGLPGGVQRALKEVVVVPDGTYRLVGRISDAEFPSASVGGARVEVTPGPLVATADVNGQYRLYGVPAEAQVQVTADGYLSQTQSLQLVSHTTRNFQLLASEPRLDLTGNYTLGLDVVDGCPGSTPLAAELQHRSYEAVMTQSGLTLDVLLTEPRFTVENGLGNRFSGQVTPTGATFRLRAPTLSFYYYFYYGDPDVAERLPNGTYLVVHGDAVTAGSRAGLSGNLQGSFVNYNSVFPVVTNLASCTSSAHRFTLSPR